MSATIAVSYVEISELMSINLPKLLVLGMRFRLNLDAFFLAFTDASYNTLSFVVQFFGLITS